MKLKEWGAFALLGLIWGSSFLWIKVVLQEAGPFMLVAFRVLFGLLGLLIVMRLQRQALPRDRATILKFVFMGVFNTAVPFLLISWGETRIESSLASILNGTVPLFTIVIAHFWLHDEKITLPRLASLIVGFAGVVVLVSRNLGAQGQSSDVLGELAVLLAAVSYATALTFSRRYLRGTKPVVQSTMILIVATSVMWVTTPLVEQPFTLPVQPLTWLALAWLGGLGLCIAYLLFFYLNNVWGPTRASLVTYVFPVVGVILGVLFLNEEVSLNLIVGSLLIVASVAVVNLKLRAKTASAVSAAAK
jgi:drug/metabolite transporter (DMT)-like permease